MQPENNESEANEGNLRYMDCHTHLLDYPSNVDIEAVVSNGLSLGVDKIVVNTTTSSQYSSLKQLIQKFQGHIIAGFGIHPCFLDKQEQIQAKRHKQAINANQYNIQGQNQIKSWKQQLQNIIKSKQKYSVGQIGLDFRKNILQTNPKDLQMHYFKTQLEIAIRLGRPATIHCVRAYGQMLKIFKDLNKNLKIDQQSKPNLIMHSYGGSQQITKSMLKLANLNIFFSLCLKRSPQLCSVIPIDKLICQTDSPCQNNIDLLVQLDRLKYNRYYFKNKQIAGNKDSQQQGQAGNMQKIQTNQPVNLVTNIKSLIKYYTMDEPKFTKIIYENSLRAFKLIK